MKFVKASHDTEVIKDTTLQDDLKVARKRYDLIVMSPSDQELFCEHPNAQRNRGNPGYPDDGYGDV